MSERRRSWIGPAVVLVLVAAIPTLLLLALWRWAVAAADVDDPPPAASTGPGPEPPPPLSTPLLSWRRAPGVLSRDLNRASFEAAIADFGSSLNDTSCVSVSLGGEVVGETNADVPVIPASNQKLLVAAVALERLGNDHRFVTEVLADQPEAGVVAGDLFLLGGGDPVLTSDAYPTENDRFPVTGATSLDALADSVVALGITRVGGDVVGDATRYDDELYVPSWSPDVRVLEGGPYDALMVNDSRVLGEDERAADPAEAGARELIALLEQRGVVVDGDARAGAAPTGLETIASVRSRRLPAIVSEMLMTSDNNTAELLVKEIGLAAAGTGTRDAGLAAIRETLDGWGSPMAGLELADGSGLSNDNRVTCALMDAVLERFGPASAFGRALPVAGESGTLADVFADLPVAGRLRAKTGTLGNPPFDADPPAVKALSGYVPVSGGDVIGFSLILNGAGPIADQSEYRPIWDALAVALGEYPSGPTTADLAPR